MPAPEAKPAKEGSETYAWYVVGILTLAYVVAFADRQILALLVQPIRRDLGLSDTGVSLLGGFAFALFYSLLGLPLGRLADTRNRRWLITAGVALWSLATMLCGVARGFWQLFLARVGVGVGEATLSPAAYSMIADYFPAEKLGRAVSVYVMASAIGAGLALILGGAVVGVVSAAGVAHIPALGEIRPWEMAFFAVGAPGLLVAVLMLTVREPARRGLLASSTGEIRQVLPLGEVALFLFRRWRTYAPLIAGFSILGLFGYGVLAWAPTFYIRVHGWEASRAGYWLGLLLLVCGTAGIFVGGLFTDWLRKRGLRDAYMRVPVLTSIVLAPVSIAFPLVGGAELSLALLAVTVFCMFVPAAAAPAAIQAVTPNQMRGQITAAYSLIGNLVAIACGPTVVALVTDYVYRDDAAIGRSLAVVAAATIPLGAVILIFGFAHFGRQVAEAETSGWRR
jgi:MFS family permease